MRRVVVTLLSVLMLAALVPAAATAAPPVDPVIGTITVTSSGDYVAGSNCSLTVSVSYNTWHGVTRVQFNQELNGTWNSTPTANPARKATSAAYSFNALAYGSQVRYKVYLLDRKNFIQSLETTGFYTFPADSCPATGTVLARYPIE